MPQSFRSPRSSATLRSSCYMEDNTWAIELTDKSQIWGDVKSVHETEPAASSSSPTPPSDDDDDKKLSGWRYATVVFVLLLGLFLSAVETSITATALVSIGHYFNDSITSTWVVLSYLLSYMGFSVIVARLSDGAGRKSVVILSWVLFAGFSLASGFAQSLTQLIAFRTVQGIGGSGLFSLAMIVIPELAPKRLWAFMSSLMGIALACSYVVGPVLGGLIVQRTTWRWIYLFNGPAAAVAIPVLLIAWPRRPKANSQTLGAVLAQIDILGAIFLLAASVLLVFGIQEAGAMRYRWDSAVIVTTLVLSGVCWIAFTGWIYWLSSSPAGLRKQPIFPLSAALQRPTGPALLMTFLTGFPFFTVIINLPLRFQIVNGDSPVMAGLHLVPMLGLSALGSGLGGVLSSKRNLTSPTLILGGCFVLLGSGLLSTVSQDRKIDPAQYGYQIMLGFGTGLSFSASVLMTTLANSSGNVASLQGAIGQARILGGSIALSLATIIFNHNIAVDLPGILSPTQLSNLQQSITTIFDLELQQQIQVAQVFAKSFNNEMRLCMYLSVAAVVVALLTWQKKPASSAYDKSQPSSAPTEPQDNA